MNSNSKISGQLMIILSEESTDSARKNVEQIYKLLHVFPPRILIVNKALANDKSSLNKQGILLITDYEVPDEIFQSLSNVEKKWVKSWQLAKFPKERFGDGESWDSSAYKPP